MLVAAAGMRLFHNQIGLNKERFNLCLFAQLWKKVILTIRLAQTISNWHLLVGTAHGKRLFDNSIDFWEHEAEEIEW